MDCSSPLPTSSTDRVRSVRAGRMTVLFWLPLANAFALGLDGPPPFRRLVDHSLLTAAASRSEMPAEPLGLSLYRRSRTDVHFTLLPLCTDGIASCSD